MPLSCSFLMIGLRPAEPGSALVNKYLGKVNHPITRRGYADTREPEIAFDITAVTGTVQPSINYFPRTHGP